VQCVNNDLLRDFETWKTNDELQFWLDRHTQSSAVKMAAHLVKGSEPYADLSLRRNELRIRRANAQSGDNVAIPSGSSSKHGRSY
jgi:hypothetical protein